MHASARQSSPSPWRWLWLLAAGLALASCRPALVEYGRVDDEGMIRKGYDSVPALVTMLSGEAGSQFHYFFDDASPVVVEPFLVLDESASGRKVSVLGATLADQLAAVVSNEAVARWRPWSFRGGEQRVSGLLQEMDGYLRVRVSGVNYRGERRAYVVNVEMSEPIHRALHTYVAYP
ncbi:MAG: hypothetical protein ACOY3Z_07410 [Thermodesulfobacteriota bacterium]